MQDGFSEARIKYSVAGMEQTGIEPHGFSVYFSVFSRVRGHFCPYFRGFSACPTNRINKGFCTTIQNKCKMKCKMKNEHVSFSENKSIL